MKKYLFAIILLTSCKFGNKEKIYTDSEGKHFKLCDRCILSHKYTFATTQMAGKIPITTWHKGTKCDSIITDIIYIK